MENIFNQLIDQRLKENSSINKIQGPKSEDAKKKMDDMIKKLGSLRGRDLHYPYMSSGRGNGPHVELLDGSVKLDLIGAIGVYLLGHSHPVLMKSQLEAGLDDVVMQGNLLVSQDLTNLLETLLSLASKSTKVKHGWITTCGTMANEIATKIIRQKHNPKYHFIALQKSFAGRSTAMQELTDNAKLRQGQPLHGEFHHIPYFNPSSPSPLQDSVNALKEKMSSYGDHIGAACLELIQGEGGIVVPPKDYVQGLIKEIKKLNLTLWIDEIQTFGRTGDLFAYDYYGIGEHVDVVTIAKILQNGACLWREELNPKPGLIAGTFNGSTGSLRAGKATLDYLTSNNMLGKSGKITTISNKFADALRSLGEKTGKISEVRNAGALLAFKVYDGAMEINNKFLNALYKNGVIGFSAGRGPMYVRFLLPAAVLEESHIKEAITVIEKTLEEVSP